MENGVATINKEKLKVKKPSLYKVIIMMILQPWSL